MNWRIVWVTLLMPINRCIICASSPGHAIYINPLLAQCPEAHFTSGGRGRDSMERLLFGLHSAGSFPDLKRNDPGGSLDRTEGEEQGKTEPRPQLNNPPRKATTQDAREDSNRLKHLRKTKKAEQDRASWRSSNSAQNAVRGSSMLEDCTNCLLSCRLGILRFLQVILIEGDQRLGRGDFSPRIKDGPRINQHYILGRLNPICDSVIRTRPKVGNAQSPPYRQHGKMSKLSARQQGDRDVAMTLNSLAQLAVMRLGNLQHVLQWDNAIAKRVSLVHPDLVDEPLDFVMSMNNIDPDLLYHVQELTESGMRQPPDTDISRFLLADARTPWRVKRWVQSEYSLMALRRYTKTLKKSRKVHQTVVTDVIRSLLSTFRSGTGKSRAATTFGFMPVAPRSDRGLSKKMRKRGEGAGVSRGTSRVPPWSCSVSTRWRDMGLHVFPRYIQETDCRRNNNSTHTPHSHPHPHPDPDPPTCYDGHYHCRPTTTAVQVLVRHPGNCNDSRVPVNIRDYYFLSVVTIPTGCQCGP